MSKLPATNLENPKTANKQKWPMITSYLRKFMKKTADRRQSAVLENSASAREGGGVFAMLKMSPIEAFPIVWSQER